MELKKSEGGTVDWFLGYNTRYVRNHPLVRRFLVGATGYHSSGRRVRGGRAVIVFKRRGASRIQLQDAKGEPEIPAQRGERR